MEEHYCGGKIIFDKDIVDLCGFEFPLDYCCKCNSYIYSHNDSYIEDKDRFNIESKILDLNLDILSKNIKIL